MKGSEDRLSDVRVVLHDLGGRDEAWVWTQSHLSLCTVWSMVVHLWLLVIHHPVFVKDGVHDITQSKNPKFKSSQTHP